jgi:hypothetical protein
VKGFARKPSWVRAGTWALWTVVVSLPVQVMVLFGHPPLEATAIWAKLAPQNKLVMGFAALAALGVGRVSPVGWWATLGFVAVALWNNWILLKFPGPIPRWAVSSSSALALFAALWMLRPAAVRLFHTPSLHWWRNAERYRVTAPVELESPSGRRVHGTVFNLSRTGLFVVGAPGDLEPGDRCRVTVRLENRVLSAVAQVVRRTEASGVYPEGIGLRFARLPLADRVWLRRSLSSFSLLR